MIFPVLFVFVASFIGSLQVGPVNGLVISFALENEKRKTRQAIIGGVLPELVYSLLAIILVLNVSVVKEHIAIIKIMSLLALILVALWLIFHHRNQTIHVGKKNIHFNPFFSALFRGLLNPQLFLFWVIIYTHLYRHINAHNMTLVIAMVISGALGAFFSLTFVSIVIDRYKEKISFLIDPKKVDKIVGLLIIAFVLFEALRMF